MPFPDSEDFENAKIDVDDLADIVNGSATVTTRLGGDKLSVDQALSQIIVGEVAVYSAAATYTDIDDWVEYNGVVYRPLPSELPIGPEAFDASHWSVAQGFATANNVALTVDGIAQENIEQYLNNIAPQDDYAAVRALDSTKFATGSHVYVKGFADPWEKNTGWAALSATDNGWYIVPDDYDASTNDVYYESTSPIVDARIFGVLADNSDDTAAMQAAINYCVQSADPATYLNLSPYNGILPELVLPNGIISTNQITIPGSVHFKGQMVGSYAGTVWRQRTENINHISLQGDSDSNSNASVFSGIRFKSGSATSADVSQISGDDTLTGINSIYFWNCWFQTPERYSVTVIGDDWRFIGCTFDVSAFRFVRLGTSSRASTNAKFIGCTYFQFSQWMFEAVNATGVQVSGGKAYASGGIDFDQAAPNQQGSFFLNQSNIHARGDIHVSDVVINDVSQVAQTNRPNFKIKNCSGSNVGGSVNVIGIGGGSELLGYDISDNEFETVGACTGIDMTGTAVRRSKIKNNVFTSNDGLGVRAYNITDARNDDNDFSGNRDFLFLNASNWINYAKNKMNYRVETAVINPPSISSDGSWDSSAQTLSGASVGDTVEIDPTSSTWPINKLIEVKAFVTATDQVTLTYSNSTGSAIDPVAHQFYMTVLPRDN